LLDSERSLREYRNLARIKTRSRSVFVKKHPLWVLS
jgi:hypothetical protein